MPQQRDELDDLLDGPDSYDELDDLLEVSPKKKSRWGDYVGMAIRGLGGFVGNAGGFIGAGAAGLGDALAQGFERVGGSREAFSLGELGVNAATGAIPFGKAARGIAGVATGVAKGAATAGVNAGAIDVVRQRDAGTDWSDLDWGSVGDNTRTGAVVGAGGAGLGAVAEKFLGRGGASTVKGRRWDPASKTFVATAEPTMRETAEAVNPFPSLQQRGQDIVDVGMPSPGRAALDPNAPLQGDPLVVAEQQWPRRSKATPVTRRSQIDGIEPEIVEPPQPMPVLRNDPTEAMAMASAKQPSLPESPIAPFLGKDYADFEARQHQLTRDAFQDTIDKLGRRGKYAEELDPELPAPTTPSREINGSGESSASMEAMSRARGMQSRGEQFVVFDRAGNERPVSYAGDPDAVDYFPKPGETTAVRKADGTLELRDDNGGKVPATKNTADETAGAGTGPSTGRRPKVPAEISFLHRDLIPKWQEKGGDPEDLDKFTARIFGEPNERKLMGAERKARRAALARDPNVAEPWKALGADRNATLGEKLKTMFGDDSGSGGDAGFIDRELQSKIAQHLGGAAVGAGVGAVGSKDDETRERNVIGGAILGALGPLAWTKRGQQTAKSAAETLGKLRYFSMLGSVSAQGKNILGNSGATVVRAAEELASGNSEGAKQLLSEVFSGKTLEDVIDAYKHAPATDTRWGSNTGVLGFFSRLMHAIDEGVVSGMERGGLSHDEAKLSTLTSDPRSETGKWLANRPEAMSAVVPFVRTAANLLERGLEHTPGVGMLPHVRAMRPEDSLRRVLARQGLGAAALTAGAAVGGDNPYVSAFMGPLAVPYAAGVAGKEAWDKRGDGLKNITAAELELLESLIPLPSGSFTSPYDLERYLASYVPSVLKDASLVDPREFKTGETIFDQSIAKVPFLNEALLKRKARRAEKRDR